MKNQQQLSEMAEREYPYVADEGEDIGVIQSQFPIDNYRKSFIKGYQAAQEEMKQHAIDFLDSIRDYEQQSKDLICDDERSSEELYNIFIEP